MPPRTVFVCRGSHCREAPKRDRLDRLLASLPVSVRPVRCQKVCKGPVVGLRVDGELLWFREVASEKSRQALSRLVLDGTLAKPLRKRRSARRSGKLRA